MNPTIDVLAACVTVLLAGCELAVGAFVHPVLVRLPDAAHAAAAKPLARVMGKAMPFWYAAAVVACVVALFTRDVGSASWWACVSAAAMVALTVPFSLICLVPINNRVAAWDLDALPNGWKDDRRRWDRFHAIRIAMLLSASLAIVAATAWRTPGG